MMEITLKDVYEMLGLHYPSGEELAQMSPEDQKKYSWSADIEPNGMDFAKAPIYDKDGNLVIEMNVTKF